MKLNAIIQCSLMLMTQASLRGTKNSNSAADGLVGHRGSVLHWTDDPFRSSEAPREDPAKQDNDAAQYFEDGLLVLNKDGHVEAVGDFSDLSQKHDLSKVVNHGKKLIMPGFIDGHVHNSQEGMIASFGKWLLPWLDDYVFPTEAMFGANCGLPVNTTTTEACSRARLEYAKPLAEQFVADLLAEGTTTAATFTTVFKESTEALFREAERTNMRLIAGKLGQDRTEFGPFNTKKFNYYDTAESFYNDSKELIEKWHDKPGARTLYAVTPRFAPSSTEAQLAAAGKLLKEHPEVYMQTHLGENFDEVALVTEMYSNLTAADAPNKTYAEVYDHFGLVTNKSLFGHSIHLSPSDWELMAARGGSVVHCPTSNMFLGSGLFNLGAATRAGVPVAVASDVGAGTSLSTFRTLDGAYKVAQLANTWLTSIMPEGEFPGPAPEGDAATAPAPQTRTIRTSAADVADPVLAQQLGGKYNNFLAAPEGGVAPNNVPLSASKAFYLATLGSAKALRLDDKIGNFAKGKEADFVVVDLDGSRATKNRMTHVHPKKGASDEAKDVLWQKMFALMMMGDDRNVDETYLMGKRVHCKSC